MTLHQIDWSVLLETLENELTGRGSVASPVAADEAWRDVRRYVRQYAMAVLARDPLFRDDVDDITQLVLLKLQSIETLQMLRQKASPTGYLIVMIKNASTDLLRSRGRERSAHRKLRIKPLGAARASRARLAMQARLSAAVVALPDKDRRLLRLRFWENMSIGELAEREGCSYSAMAVRLFRLLKRLEGSMRIDE